MLLWMDNKVILEARAVLLAIRWASNSAFGKCFMDGPKVEFWSPVECLV